jgi:drug/metabolite transporter (DMT)-like permease
MDVALALAAALLFSLGTVLQQQVAATASEEEARGAGFLIRLARKPRWLAGIAADALGFVAQAAALGLGRIVVVQPLLATSVVFALPLGARLEHKPVSRPEILAALAVTAGLGAFLVLADPEGGVENASATAWIVSFAVAGVLCAGLVLGARGRAPVHRAAMLGTAAGILFALTAALTKVTADQFEEGVFEIFVHWHLYALIVVGYISMTLNQLALGTGVLAPAIATSIATDPIVSVIIGTTLLQESLHETPFGVVGTVLSLLVALGAIAILARSQEGGAATKPGSGAVAPPQKVTAGRHLESRPEGA